MGSIPITTRTIPRYRQPMMPLPRFMLKGEISSPILRHNTAPSAHEAADNSAAIPPMKNKLKILFSLFYSPVIHITKSLTPQLSLETMSYNGATQLSFWPPCPNVQSGRNRHINTSIFIEKI